MNDVNPTGKPTGKVDFSKFTEGTLEKLKNEDLKKNFLNSVYGDIESSSDTVKNFVKSIKFENLLGTEEIDKIFKDVNNRVNDDKDFDSLSEKELQEANSEVEKAIKAKLEAKKEELARLQNKQSKNFGLNGEITDIDTCKNAVQEKLKDNEKQKSIVRECLAKNNKVANDELTTNLAKTVSWSKILENINVESVYKKYADVNKGITPEKLPEFEKEIKSALSIAVQKELMDSNRWQDLKDADGKEASPDSEPNVE